MKHTIQLFNVLAAILLLTGTALAEVTSIQLRFGGGCTTENEDGGCTLRAIASGTDLQATQLALERANDDSDTDAVSDIDDDSISSQYSNAEYLPFGRPRTPSASGRASWRFRNDPDPDTCYKARDLSGNVHSNIICIGDTETDN